MSKNTTCPSCAIVSGDVPPPGGVVFENKYWMVVLRANPVRSPCLPMILLKRHVEDIAYLDPKEGAALGQTMQWTAQIVTLVLQPARVHFGIYAEEVKHLHVHVFPRMPNMPRGNIRNLWIGAWLDLLHAIGLKKSYPNDVVAEYAERLRQAYLELAKYNPVDETIEGGA